MADYLYPVVLLSTVFYCIWVIEKHLKELEPSRSPSDASNGTDTCASSFVTETYSMAPWNSFTYKGLHPVHLPGDSCDTRATGHIPPGHKEIPPSNKEHKKRQRRGMEKGATRVLLVIGVLSHAAAFQDRTIIRDTWASPSALAQLEWFVFLILITSCHITLSLSRVLSKTLHSKVYIQMFARRKEEPSL